MSDETTEGLSLQAMFADAVLAAKKHLDASNRLIDADQGRTEPGVMALVSACTALGDAYARLAQALQHGAPGQRF